MQVVVPCLISKIDFWITYNNELYKVSYFKQTSLSWRFSIHDVTGECIYYSPVDRRPYNSDPQSTEACNELRNVLKA